MITAKAQNPEPVSCPGPLKQCAVHSQFCHETEECSPLEACCESVCGFGVCSIVGPAAGGADVEEIGKLQKVTGIYKLCKSFNKLMLHT